MTRVYVPITVAQLRELVSDLALAGPLPAHGVTGRLREAWPDGDDEDWEYAALMAAAVDSWTLRGADDPPRRYVVAADAAAVETVETGAATGLTLPEGLTWVQVASVHADVEDLDQALVDDPESVADEDLAWFATQEVGALL